jgi:hypothetical protein
MLSKNFEFDWTSTLDVALDHKRKSAQGMLGEFAGAEKGSNLQQSYSVHQLQVEPPQPHIMPTPDFQRQVGSSVVG